MSDGRSSALRRAIDWAFRSRETGRIVVGQRPNALLILFFATWGASWGANWLLAADGTAARALLAASRVALALWAADELLRGVNPWRRVLGLAVLAYVAHRILA